MGVVRELGARMAHEVHDTLDVGDVARDDDFERNAQARVGWK
jgi:hypothetical protein